MKGSFYYAGFLAIVLLGFVTTGPATFATTTDTTEPLGTTDQTQTPQDGTVTVAVGQGSTPAVQNFTFTPQTVEINAGESVTWFSPAEIMDFHTVTFVLDQNARSELLVPFAVPEDTDFELLPPFNVGEHIRIPTPEGGEGVLAANKVAWFPSAVDANNQTTFLNGTEIQYILDGTERVINSGIIQPPMPPTGEVVGQNTTATEAEGEIREVPGAAVTNETTTTGSATTDTLTPPEEGEAASQAIEEGGQPPGGFPFPIVSSFTVTFQESGTYPYFCAVHPWMTGQVVVRGDAQTGTEPQPPQPQTPTETQPPQPQTPSDGQGPGELESPSPLFG